MKVKGVLFNVKVDVCKDNGLLMIGNFEVNFKKISIGVFLKVFKEFGKDYLNLKVGDKEGFVFYGKFFCNMDKKGEKFFDYIGYVELSIGNDVL